MCIFPVGQDLQRGNKQQHFYGERLVMKSDGGENLNNDGFDADMTLLQLWLYVSIDTTSAGDVKSSYTYNW